MSTTLLTQETLQTATEIEAADSRFFDAQEFGSNVLSLEEFRYDYEIKKKITGFHQLSEGFWFHVGGMMTNNVVYAWQVGTNRSGLCDPTDQDVRERVSVIFDAKQKQDHEYTWQVIEADHRGRTSHKITVNEDSAVASRRRWSPDGRLIREDPLDDEEAAEIMTLVTDVVRDPDFKQHISGRWAIVKKARENVLSFEREKEKFGKSLFEKKLKDLQEQARKAGLVACLGLK